MADVVFGFVHDFGAGEEWVARRGGGALLDGVPLDPGVPERRVGGKLELLGIESADPRWVRDAADELAETAHRLRAIGAIAVTLCQVAAGAARRDGRRCAARAPSTSPPAQLIVREAGGFVAFTACADPLGAPVDDLPPVSPVVAARSAAGHRRAGARAARLSAVERACHPQLDGRLELAAKVAEGVAALQPAGDPRRTRRWSGPRTRPRRSSSAYTGLTPVAGALPVAEAVDRKAWIDANLRSIRGVLDPAAARAAAGAGPLGGVVGAAAGAVLGVEAGAISGFLAGRVLGPVRVPGARPGRAGAAAVRRAQPRPRGRDARRRGGAAAALGGAARDHARAAVRRRAVAARRTSPAWCAT